MLSVTMVLYSTTLTPGDSATAYVVRLRFHVWLTGARLVYAADAVGGTRLILSMSTAVSAPVSATTLPVSVDTHIEMGRRPGGNETLGGLTSVHVVTQVFTTNDESNDRETAVV